MDKQADSQAVSQSLRQSVIQSFIQSVDQSCSQLDSQLVTHSLTQSVSQLVSQSVSRCTGTNMMQCSEEGKGSKGTRVGAGLWRVKDTRAAIYQCPSNLRISTVLAAFIYPPFTKSGGERGAAPRVAKSELGLGVYFVQLQLQLQLLLLLLLHSKLFYICLPTFVRICLVSCISDCALAFLSSVFLSHLLLCALRVDFIQKS